MLLDVQYCTYEYILVTLIKQPLESFSPLVISTLCYICALKKTRMYKKLLVVKLANRLKEYGKLINVATYITCHISTE